MSENGKTLTFVQEINAPRSQVYRAFSSAAGLLEWLGDYVEAEGREGGRFYIWWNAGYFASGKYLHLAEDHKVAFSWNGGGDLGDTRVRVLIEEQGEGSKVTLMHDGIGVGEAWEAQEKGFNENWPYFLANLKSGLETGVDKRLYDRPMLGFFIGGFVDENLKKRLDLPVDAGVHVTGVLEGMGAQKSGLQGDDVIYKLDDVPIESFTQLGQLIGKYKGGDVVKTVIYREGKALEIDVELSKRPIPAFPAPPEQLADQGRKTYKAVMSEIKAALKGVSKKEAGVAPGPGEWSVKEVLAHLLVAERWNIEAWALHPEGDKLPPYPGGNRLVSAIAQTYSLKDLLKELKNSSKLQMNLIRTLPEEYAATKSSYFGMGNDMEDGIRRHFEEHIAQIKTAIAAVRAAKTEPVEIPE